MSSAPPPGFEELDQPQSTLLDMVFLGRVVGNVPATFDRQFTTFERPLDLLAKLADVRDAEPVLRALSGRLPNNTERLCRRQKEDEEDCGRIAPEVAGIILDPARFRAELFINPKYLRQGVSADKFLPPPSGRDFAFVGLTGALAGSRGNSATYNFRQDSRFGAGATRLVTQSQKAENGPLTFDGLKGEHDEGTWRYTAGLFRTQPLASIGELGLLGLSLNTTTDTLVDRGAADPNQLAVFLSRRAQVRVLREGRLLYSQIYEAGNQVIDPRLLPDGAYEVTLQINEGGGAVREEKRFFVKQEAIPTEGTPFYFFDAGRLVRNTFTGLFPTVSTEPVARVGTRQRIAPSWALGGDILSTTQEALAEFSVIQINADFLGRYAVFGTTHQDVGASVSLSAAVDDYNYSIFARKVRANHADSGGGVLRSLTLDNLQLSTAVFRSIGEGSLGLRAQLTESEGQPRSYAFGPSFRYPLFTQGIWRVDFLADALQSDREKSIFFRLNLRANTFSESLSIESGSQYGRENNSLDAYNRFGASNRIDGSKNFRDILGDDDLTATLGAGRAPTGESMLAAADYRNPRGRFNGAVERTDSGTGIGRTYNMNVATNVLGGNFLGGDGTVAYGGADIGESALVVAIRGDAPENEFVVYVDGAVKGRLRAGERRTIIVAAYKTYDVRIASLGGGNVHYDNDSRRLTVYPGNVASTTWLVRQVTPAFGRILDGRGQPLVFARIEGGVEPSFTDDLGYFQVEVPGATTLKVLPRSGAACEFPVEPGKDTESYVRLGVLTCSATN